MGRRSPLLMSVLLLLMLTRPPGADAQDDTVVELGEDDFEIIAETDDGAEDVEVTGEAEEESMGTKKRLGRFHPPIVHFAVAWSFLMLPLALARVLRERLGRLDMWVLAGTVAAAAAAVSTGLLHAPAVMSRPDIEELVELHEHTGIALLAILGAGLVVRILWDRLKVEPLKWLYLLLMTASAILVLVVGHLGGSITFGENFLF